jgi:cellulose synthase/poly-beta-1,6-N-acetylglucosamine synthase-like glycosyltransferase
MTAPTVRAVPPPYRLHVRRGVRPVISVVSVFVVMAALTVGYYVAVLGGFGNLSYVTVGIAFLLGTDGLLLAFSTGRRTPAVSHGPAVRQDDVSVIIACYNGSDVIGETLESLLVHVAPENIIVVSDCSTDDTVAVARSYGVRVVENRFNRNKPLSVSRVAPMVTTPYTLIIDDDTHVGPEPIPVELLRQGAAAVAFDVMPIETGTLVNRMQTFEYRKSMTLAKALMSEMGAVANVSGAVGLFRTADLRRQASRHSGHFPGEDLQRTLLAHLESEGRGVAFSSNQVETLAPASWRELYGQRAKKWGPAEHELLFLNFKLMLDPRVHFSLRYERGYSVFVLLTDPLRMLFFATLLFSPGYFVFLYLLYLPLEAAAWLRTGRKDPVTVVLLAPLYNLFKLVARFRAHFQWFRLKWDYLFRRRYHRLVAGRNLPVEYAGVAVVLAVAWIVTVTGVVARLS